MPAASLEKAPAAAPATAPAPTPPAPAPAPAPAAAPAPSAAPPAPGPTPPPEENPFAEIDAILQKVDAAPKQTVGKGKEPKPEFKAPAAPAKPQPSKEPADLRKELQRLQGELETRNKTYAELEAKIKDFESKGKDTQLLTERLAAMEKTIAEKDATLRALRQEESPEFKKQYDAPFDDAAEEAKAFVEHLDVENAETGEVRKATWEDFKDIWITNKTSPQKAIAKAKELFGDAAQVVVTHLMELNRLDSRRNKALKAERENAAARAKEEESKAVQRREQINATWATVNKELSERVDDYHDAPDDAEASAARNKGLAIIDAEPATLRERIVRDAHVRQRAAAFGPLKLKVARLEAEIAALKAKLGEEEEVPGKPARPSSGGAPAPEKSWEEQARAELGNAH